MSDILNLEYHGLKQKAGVDDSKLTFDDLQKIIHEKVIKNVQVSADVECSYFELGIEFHTGNRPNLGTTLADGSTVVALYDDQKSSFDDFRINLLELAFTAYDYQPTGSYKPRKFKFPTTPPLAETYASIRIVSRTTKGGHLIDPKDYQYVLNFKNIDHGPSMSYTEDVYVIKEINQALQWNMWQITPGSDGGTAYLYTQSAQLSVFTEDISQMIEQKELKSSDLSGLIFEEEAFGMNLKFANVNMPQENEELKNCCPTVIQSLGYEKSYVLEELGMKDENEGCKPFKIIEFCSKHNHSIYIVDQNHSIITHSLGTDPSHKPCLMVMLTCNHMELINDQTIRNRIRESAKDRALVKSDSKTITVKCKYCDYKSDSQYELFIHDLETHKPERKTLVTNSILEVLDCIKSQKNTNIKTAVDANEIFKAVIKHQKLVGSVKFKSQKMVSIYYADRNIYVYRSDDQIDQKVCEGLGIQYNHQSLSSIACEYIDREIEVDYKSFLNEDMKAILDICPVAMVGNFCDVSALAPNNYYEIDIIKLYSWILMNFDVPKVNPIAYFERFNNEKIVNYWIYLIKPANNHWLVNHPFITGYTVNKAVKDGLLIKSEIYGFCRTSEIQSQHFEKVFKDFYEKTTEGKKLANYANGCFRGTEKITYKNPIVTTSEREAIYNRIVKDSHLSKIANKESEGMDIYCVLGKEKIKRFSNGTPIYNTVIELGRLALYELMKFVSKFGSIVQVKTDSVIFSSNLLPNEIDELINQRNIQFVKASGKPEHVEKFGQYKPVKMVFLERIQEMKHIIEPRTFQFDTKYSESKDQFIPVYWNKSINVINYKEDEDFKMNWLFERIFYGKSCMINGPGGTGKSEIIKRLIQQLDIINKDPEAGNDCAHPNPIRYKLCAFTNTAANNINGETLHHLFKISISNRRILDEHLRKFCKDTELIIIDEVGMIPSYLYSVLKMLKHIKPDLVILMLGDWLQIKPVGEEYLEFRENPIVNDLSDYTIINLKKNYRLAKSRDPISSKKFLDYNEKCRLGEMEYKIEKMGKRRVVEYNSKEMFDTKINLTYTNRMRIYLNGRYMEQFKNPASEKLLTKSFTKDKSGNQVYEHIYLYVGLPIVANVTRYGTEIFDPSNYSFDGENFNVIDKSKVGKSLNIHKNEHYIIKSLDCESLTIETNPNLAYHNMGVPIIKSHKITKDELLRIFVPGYAFTGHKTQSLTITETYNIHEFDKMKSRVDGKALLYTALGRCKDTEDIRIVYYPNGVEALNISKEYINVDEEEFDNIVHGIEIVESVSHEDLINDIMNF